MHLILKPEATIDPLLASLGDVDRSRNDLETNHRENNILRLFVSMFAGPAHRPRKQSRPLLEVSECAIRFDNHLKRLSK